MKFMSRRANSGGGGEMVIGICIWTLTF